ncbi:MAG: diaminopimelate epimerase, partial [Desulfovibrio sp.]|nr:diaminopimelate epimerase [Desulfovibrio sp.]
MPKISFTKMQGCGNDYVYINCFTQSIEDPAGLARFVSDRHFGVGSDGLVLILPSEKCDLRMRMFNADGTEAEMCGNAARCVGRFAVEHGLVSGDCFKLETAAGSKSISIERKNGKITEVVVDMGEPIFEPEKIPVEGVGGSEYLVDVPLVVSGEQYQATLLSMGNPHCVVF